MVQSKPDVHEDRILATLNATQQQAVQHVEGPLLMLAGPGSGKTRVVTHRIAYLLQQGIPDRNILALTFTNKAADEMRSRLDRLVPNNHVWLGTFHRFCSRLLRHHASLVGLRENFSIYDTHDSLKLLKEAIDEADVSLLHETPARIASAVSWSKNNLITSDEYTAAPGNPRGAIVERVYPQYQKRLLAANAVDFDDLLLHVAVLLRENPELRSGLDERFRYILVDEYQDTNLAQYAIVRALSIDHPNLAVTGDPDQSIYGWRGATIRNILEFERDFPRVRVVRLEKNYRSTKCILRVADQLIANNQQRKEKTLYTDNAEGKPVRIVVFGTGREEADAIAARIANDIAAGTRRPRDFAIFYRTNALSRTLERALKTVGLPYQIVRGLEFYHRKEIKDVVAYLQLINNPSSDVALLRIINTPPRRIGKKTLQKLGQHARRYELPLLDAARECGLIESLAKRSAVEVARFVAMYDRLCLLKRDSVEELVGNVLHETGYREWLNSSDDEEDLQRLENIEELLTDAKEFDESRIDDGGLEAFLEQAALVSDADDWESQTDRVTMMTLHAAKGLEFPVVFVVAVESNVLPHERSMDDPDRLEEERRLLFVGITRAEEELQLSAARKRSFRGSTRHAATSMFLMEVPRDEMEVIGRLGYDPCEWDDEVWDDDETWQGGEEEWDDAPAEESSWPGTRKGRPRSSGAARPGVLVTAADMTGAAGAAFPPCSPEVFCHGMAVTHPEYGLGKIIALGGSGPKRVATVQFAGDAGQKRFVLAFSPLRPAGGKRD